MCKQMIGVKLNYKYFIGITRIWQDREQKENNS